MDLSPPIFADHPYVNNPESGTYVFISDNEITWECFHHSDNLHAYRTESAPHLMWIHENGEMRTEKVSESENEHESDNDELSQDEESLLIDLSKLHFGQYQIKGAKKEHNEDTISPIEEIPLSIIIGDQNHAESASAYYCAVYDGHGDAQCAQYCSTKNLNNIIACLRQNSANSVPLFEKSIRQGIKMTEKNFLDLAKKKKILSGSTLCSLLLYGPDSEGNLTAITSNVGDSFALLSRDGESQVLSADHSCSNKEEIKRIRKAGGKVEKIDSFWRVLGTPMCVKQGIHSIGLARSIGDIHFKQPVEILSSECSINSTGIDFAADEFIALCSDGIAIPHKDIVTIVRENKEKGPTECAKLVCEQAAKTSKDDKTCCLVFFGWKEGYDYQEGREEEEGLGEEERRDPEIEEEEEERGERKRERDGDEDIEREEEEDHERKKSKVEDMDDIDDIFQ